MRYFRVYSIYCNLTFLCEIDIMGPFEFRPQIFSLALDTTNSPKRKKNDKPMPVLHSL